jgi:hypothetical protein
MIPFPGFPPENLYLIPLWRHSPTHPSTHVSLPWHSPTLGHWAFTGTRASSPIDAWQIRPLLHMLLSHGSLHVYSLVGGLSPGNSGGSVGWYWCLPMGLQTPSAPSVLSSNSPIWDPMFSPMGSCEHLPLCLWGSVRVSQKTVISDSCQQALLDTHGRVWVWWLYKGWIYRWDHLWMAFPSVSAPHFMFIFSPVIILFSLFEGVKHPHFGLPSSWASCGLWIVSWIFQAFELISTIIECIACVFFCDRVTSLRMIFSSSIHLPKNFMKHSGNPLCKCVVLDSLLSAHRHGGFLLCLHFYSIDQPVCFMWITWGFWYYFSETSVEISDVIISRSHCTGQDSFRYCKYLIFYMKLRIALSRSVKKCLRLLMGIVLNCRLLLVRWPFLLC